MLSIAEIPNSIHIFLLKLTCSKSGLPNRAYLQNSSYAVGNKDIYFEGVYPIFCEGSFEFEGGQDKRLECSRDGWSTGSCVFNEVLQTLHSGFSKVYQTPKE